MKDLLLILALLVVIIAGHFAMKRIDAFIRQNCRHAESFCGETREQVSIAAESMDCLSVITPQLISCSTDQSGVLFSLSMGKSDRILRKLASGENDVVLLSGETTVPTRASYVSFRIPVQLEEDSEKIHNRPCQDDVGKQTMIVAWNRAVPSKARDSLLTVIRQEYGVMEQHVNA